MTTTQELIEKMRDCVGCSCCFECKHRTKKPTYTCENNMLSSAADRLEQLENQLATVTAERDKAVEDLKSILSSPNDSYSCDYCKFYQPCKGVECELYQEGKGMKIEGVNYPNFKWSCMDFDICGKLENTPCNECERGSHFQWRGLEKDGETNGNNSRNQQRYS